MTNDDHAGHVLAWRQQLAIQWLGLPIRIARQLKRQGRLRWMPADEAVSIGTVGLVKAARDYDSSRGVKFISMAWIYVQSEILTAVKREPLESRAYREGRFVHRLDWKASGRRAGYVTIDVPERPVPSAVPDWWPEMGEVRKAMRRLDGVDRLIIEMVVMRGMASREVAGLLGISFERVRQRRVRGLARLRRLMAAGGVA